jgi:hypothetical protein
MIYDSIKEQAALANIEYLTEELRYIERGMEDMECAIDMFWKGCAYEIHSVLTAQMERAKERTAQINERLAELSAFASEQKAASENMAILLGRSEQ